MKCGTGRVLPAPWLQTELNDQRFVVPLEAHHDPVRVAGAFGFEVPAVDHGRNTQTEGTEVLFQVGFDAAHDHVCELGHGVQDFFVDGHRLAHQHLGADPAS